MEKYQDRIYENRAETAQLTRLINNDIKNSKTWKVEERRDHKNVVVTYLPTNQRMLAVAYMPFKYTINLPSVDNV